MNLLTPSIFAPFQWLRAGMTTRDAAPATEPRTNLALRLPEMLGLASASIVVGQQTHSASLAVISPDPIAGAILPPPLGSLLEVPIIDGLIANSPGILIGVFTADCVPVLIIDPVERIVAAVHAGREGTRLGIARKAVEAMARLGARTDRMLAWIAPSISQPHYEVSPAMADDFHRMLGENASNDLVNGRCLDLGRINRQILMESGLSAANIELDTRCTFDRADLFYSYRRDGVGTGRMCTFAALAPQV